MNNTTVGIICLVLGLVIHYSARRGLGLKQRVTSFVFGRTRQDRLLYWGKWILGAALSIAGLLLLAGVLHVR